MSASEVQRGSSAGLARTLAPTASLGARGSRRPAKVLPEHARGHNRALVLQTLYRTEGLSRADLARATGLTRVTISDLVADLLAEGLVVELAQRAGDGARSRPGKPATPLDLNRRGHAIVGLDLSDYHAFRGALLDLDAGVLERREVPLDGATGEDAVAKVVALATELLELAEVPVLGVGVGSPGVVDLDGVVLTAPNLGWAGEPLQARLAAALATPVLVANDANVAALAEHSFGGAASDLILVKVGHGVGSGVLLDGALISGSRHAAGEIGHVVVGTDPDAPACVCGKRGCLETWLAEPRLESALGAAPDGADRAAVLAEAGRRLGIALAPVVGALDLAEVVLSGPAPLLDGPLAESAVATLRARTMESFHGDLGLRMSVLGEDIVMRGAAAMVLAGRLGVS